MLIPTAIVVQATRDFAQPLCGWNQTASLATMPAMRGNDKVLKQLGEALKAELTAINQYFLHSKMCNNWGYFRLGAYYRQESIDEMVHAEKLMDRILFLEGTPNMTEIGPIKVGTNVKAQFENDLALELQAVKQLNHAIEVSVEVVDNASRALFEEILKDEEHHVDYLEGQLHAIKEMGIENYLAQQLHKGEEEKE
jgi:bacterioferritin